MGDAKKEPFKKRLHPKPLRSKNPSSPPFKINLKKKKNNNKTKSNPKIYIYMHKGFLEKKGFSCCYKSSPTMASLVIARAQQQRLSKRRAT
jgi:hypothetical protein